MNSPPREQFSPADRLRGRDAIHRVFETGYSARRGRVLARFVFEDRRAAPLRIGVATSRAIGTAALRNRCKRLLREAARRQREECRARLVADGRAADVMFVWVDPAVTRSMNCFAEISHSVRDLFVEIARRTPGA